MKQVKFTLNLSEEEIKDTLDHYHFSRGDLRVLCSFFQALKPLIDCKAFYEIIKPDGERPKLLQFAEEECFVAAVVTLGKGPDRLMELYLEAEDVSAAYMLECLSLDLLRKSYEKLGKLIAREEKLYIKKYEFPGGRYPLEKTKDILDYFSQNEVTYTESFMLLPQKSVVFLGELTKKEQEKCVHICESCGNIQCSNRIMEKKSYVNKRQSDKTAQRGNYVNRKESRENEKQEEEKRPLPYGYERIFGKEQSWSRD